VKHLYSRSKATPCSTRSAAIQKERSISTKWASLFVLSISVLALLATVHAQEQTDHTNYYVFDGTTLQVVDNFSFYRTDQQWQVWLYQEGVHVPSYSAGLQYSRWGLIQGRSVESVKRRLKAAQNFEKAYVNFFGPGTWGGYTFFNALGPIAITAQSMEKNPATLDDQYQFERLYDRVNSVIVRVQPSLENNESQGPTASVKEYFDQIRDALQQVSKLYSRLAQPSPQASFIKTKVAQTDRAIVLAGNNVPKITASLPSVKLPANNAWMSHTEAAGSDGTIRFELTQVGSGVSVRQTWTGGDGAMTGTVIVTIVPFDDIGSIRFHGPVGMGDRGWAVVVESAHGSFPETMDSPLRERATRVFPAVHLTTTTNSVYFSFADPAEAHDAYAYFLYHQQLGHR